MDQNARTLHPERVLQTGRNAALMHAEIFNNVADDYETNNRGRLLIAFMSLALEHQDSILYLLSTGKHAGSALALLRPLLDTAVRGLWFHYLTTDEQIHKFEQGLTKPPKFGPMIDALENATGNPGLFASLKDHWNALCDLTHSGIGQLGRRVMADGSIDVAYDEGEMIEALQVATSTLTMFAMFFCSIMQRETQRSQIAARYKDLFG
jgi:hypothetical protein